MKNDVKRNTYVIYVWEHCLVRRPASRLPSRPSIVARSESAIPKRRGHIIHRRLTNVIIFIERVCTSRHLNGSKIYSFRSVM